MKGRGDAWDIDEVLFRYDEDKSLRGVWTEGATDQRVVEWFIKARGVVDVEVLTVDSINIPPDVVLESGNQVGNRGRLLTFAKKVIELSSESVLDQVTLIIDRDFDTEPPKPFPDWEGCLYTDFASIDIYAWNINSAGKIISLYALSDRLDPKEIVRQSEQLLPLVFFLRKTLHLKDYGISIKGSISDFISVSNGSLVLNIEEMARRSINACRDNKPDLQTVMKEFSNMASSEKSDPRKLIHKDDLHAFLTWRLRGQGIPSNALNVEAISRMLLVCLDHEELTQHLLFRVILQRLGGDVPVATAIDCRAA